MPENVFPESYDLQCSPALCNCDVSRGKGVRGDVYTTHSPLSEEELEQTVQTQNNALAVSYTAVSNTQETHRIKGSGCQPFLAIPYLNWPFKDFESFITALFKTKICKFSSFWSYNCPPKWGWNVFSSSKITKFNLKSQINDNKTGVWGTQLLRNLYQFSIHC